MTLQQWQQADGTNVTFEDRRGGVKATPEPAPFTLPVTMQEVAGHEARHAAAFLILDFKTVEATADIPSANAYGHVVIDSEGEHWDQLRVAEWFMAILVGGIGEKNWPPPWPLNPAGAEQDERQLHALANRLHLTEHQYKGLSDVAHWFVTQSAFKKIEQRIDTLLGCGLTLNSKQLEDIHASVREETRPQTEAEREEAELREQHRQWMAGVMEAGTEYAREQAEEKAARDLRRRCDELAADAAAHL